MAENFNSHISNISIEEMSTFCKRKGFVYSNSEIYGGMSGFFDYGPLGVEVKNNIKQDWWKIFVKSRDDVVGIDGTIISHQKVWQASGHVGCFADLMVECTKCRARKRADQLIEDELSIAAEGLSKEDINKLIEQNNLKCPICKGNLSKPKEFNLMFKTCVGPVESEEAVAYLRPETAQQMFTNFKIITETARVQLPFGIAQIGRAFRNEISPRDFLFRCREFEQMELEYFIHPEEKKCNLLAKQDLDYEFQILTAETQEKKSSHEKNQKKNLHEQVHIQKLKIKDILKMQLMEEWHAYWLKQQYQWFVDLGIKKENLRLREHRKDELAHYSSACFDIEYNFPFGWKEIHGMANRGSFDLEQHQKHSKKSFELFDEATKKKVLPKVIEPSQGVDRAFLAFMFDAYTHDPKNKERDWIVLKLHKKLVPTQVAVLPLVNKLEDKAKEVYNLLKNEFVCFYDRSGAIGRRYARADEIGIPLCLTIDFETIEKDNCVTIRERDTTKQIRVKITDLKEKLREIFC
ncbi:glycine--tRNA ligase [Candidatus Woesearchaeota archaeon]|nr:glycine--tRNA ligase [Candidatus Woesearchaeota archaeon]